MNVHDIKRNLKLNKIKTSNKELNSIKRLIKLICSFKIDFLFISLKSNCGLSYIAQVFNICLIAIEDFLYAYLYSHVNYLVKVLINVWKII